MGGSKALRRILIALVVALLTTWFVGTHWYMAKRLMFDTDLPDWLATSGAAAIGLLGASIFAHAIAERFFHPRVATVLAWPASLWMGFAFWLLLLLLVSDSMLWLASAAAFADDGSGVDARAARMQAATVVALATAAAGPALVSGLSGPRLERVAIRLPGWPREFAGFRIVQISDIHIGSILKRDFARQVTERVNGLEPDLVAVTGDLVDGPVHRLRADVAPFGDLRARHGVWFCTGNHDHYSGAPDWDSLLREMGFKVLRNQRESVYLQNARGHFVFDVAGIDDYRSRRRPAGRDTALDEALEGMADGRFVLLLAHDPSDFRKAADRVDLQLSGHTHGGQIWPFRYFVRMAIPFVEGLYRLGRARLYVSRGTGFWGPPMRLFAPAEITEIALLPELVPGVVVREPENRT